VGTIAEEMGVSYAMIDEGAYLIWLFRKKGIAI